MLGIIIQARMGSTRFPGKVLKPIGNATILLFIINRLKIFNLPLIVATTNNPIDDELCDYLDKLNINYYRGSETNVLLRFINAAEQYGFTDIIRVCSDNPFIDILFLRELINRWTIEIDYLSFCFNSNPVILCHFGVFAEIVKLKALKMVLKFNNTYFNEHVTFSVYQMPSEFLIQLIEVPSYFERYKQIRLSVDTKQDYENIIYIYKNMVNGFDFDFFSICEFVLGDNLLLASMEKLIINNNKIKK